MSAILTLEHVCKTFGSHPVVQDLSFSVEPGEVFGFLGPNGAGKTTTIKIILGLLHMDSGSILIDGHSVEDDFAAAMAHVSGIVEHPDMYKYLSGYDNLLLQAHACGADRAQIDRVVEMVGMQARIRDKFKTYSLGMKQRLGVAQALLHDPKLMILDEPTTGLDPQSRIMVWNALDHLRRDEGLTVFLTTHYMEEASEADYVVILDSGKIVAEGTPHDLKDRYAGDFIKLYRADTAELDRLGIAYTLQNGYVQIAVAHTAQAREMIRQYPALFEDFEVVKGKMDDVFLAATGKELKEA